MRTVTICGSMKFATEMQRIAFLLETKHDMNVLQCVYNIDNLHITSMEQVALENAHYRKNIRISYGRSGIKTLIPTGDFLF
ncbi:MAG: hypothetical protein SOR79_09165 [Blautia sp.]|nr:hypothetical protein [Blautia sp.]